MKRTRVEQKVPKEHPILLIATDWRERAFILATLEEQGYDVRALPGIVIAIGFLIRRPHVHPSLIILDTNEDPDINERTLADLQVLGGDAPWIVITPVTRRVVGESFLSEMGATRISRPVRVGDLITLVKQLLDKKGSKATA